MPNLTQEEQQEFKSTTLKVAMTNILQFLVFFSFIFPYYELSRYYFDSAILSSIVLTLLIVDLYFTIQFFRILAKTLDKELNKSLVLSYTFVSALIRMYIVYNLIFGTSIFGLYMYTIGLVAVLFGLNLFVIVDGREFAHDDKLRTIMWANFTGATVIFGDLFMNIFVGIKMILPLIAGFVYLLLAFDMGNEKQLQEIVDEDELDDLLLDEEDDLNLTSDSDEGSDVQENV